MTHTIIPNGFLFYLRNWKLLNQIDYMKQTYTETDLIRFIYKDVDVFEYFEMDYAIHNNRSLKESFSELKETVKRLPKVKLSPSAAAIDNILRYNKTSFVNSLV